LPLKFYFLAEVSTIFVVVSTTAGAVVSIGVTVVVLSVVDELSLLLLQAIKAVAKIAIARSFFIFGILRIVNNRFRVNTRFRKK
jgi:xanthine/uracil/vitamin C permease (AzgA family)